MRNEKYHVLVTKLNGIKQLPHESANDMYSHLNILVNEINRLGLTPIDDDQVMRRILQVFLPNYKLIVSIIYDNKNIKRIISS